MLAVSLLRTLPSSRLTISQVTLSLPTLLPPMLLSPFSPFLRVFSRSIPRCGLYWVLLAICGATQRLRRWIGQVFLGKISPRHRSLHPAGLKGALLCNPNRLFETSPSKVAWHQHPQRDSKLSLESTREGIRLTYSKWLVSISNSSLSLVSASASYRSLVCAAFFRSALWQLFPILNSYHPINISSLLTN